MADLELRSGSNRSTSNVRRSHMTPCPSIRLEQSRSISPLVRPKKVVPSLRIGFRNTDFDECRTERRDTSRRSPYRAVKSHWQVPTNREELILRYSARYRSPTPRRYSPLRSYKLDAAELLVSRLTKFLAKYLRWWRNSVEGYRNVGFPCTRKKAEGRRSPMQESSQRFTDTSLSFHQEDDESAPPLPPRPRLTPDSAYPFSLSSGPRPFEEIETPKPFNLWKSPNSVFPDQKTASVRSTLSAEYIARTAVVSEKLRKVISAAVSRKTATAWKTLITAYTRTTAAGTIGTAIVRAVQERLSTFFAHELFLIPTSQYVSCKRMIIAVNCLMTEMGKVVFRAYARRLILGLRTKEREERIVSGLKAVETVVKERCRVDFNRLRFFAEVLETVRAKEHARLITRKRLSRLCYIMTTRLQRNAQWVLIALWRSGRSPVLRQPSFSFPKPSKPSKEVSDPLKSMLKIIGKNAEFRLQSAVTVWKELKNAKKSYEDVRIATVVITIAEKVQKRNAIGAWQRRSRKKNRALGWSLMVRTLKGCIATREMSAFCALKPQVVTVPIPHKPSHHLIALKSACARLSNLSNSRQSLLFRHYKLSEHLHTSRQTCISLLKFLNSLSLRRRQCLHSVFSSLVLC